MMLILSPGRGLSQSHSLLLMVGGIEMGKRRKKFLKVRKPGVKLTSEGVRVHQAECADRW